MKKFFGIIAILVILVSFASCSSKANTDSVTEVSASEYCKIIDAMEAHTITEKESKLKEIIIEFCEEEYNEKINFSIFYYTEDDLQNAKFVFETVKGKYYSIPVDEKVITNYDWCTDWTKLELNNGKIVLKFSNWEAREISEKDAIYLKQYCVIEDTENMPQLFVDEESKEEYDLYFNNKRKVSKKIDYDILIWYMNEYHYLYRNETRWFTI